MSYRDIQHQLVGLQEKVSIYMGHQQEGAGDRQECHIKVFLHEADVTNSSVLRKVLEYSTKQV